MKLAVVDLSNKKVGDFEYDDSLVEKDVRVDIISRVVRWQLAKRRSGNHSVKSRSEVTHTTKKPFKQKGTGRARQGMKSVSQMRGGGVAMGPVVRDHSFSLPKKIRKLGLKNAVSSRIGDKNFCVLDSLDLKDMKTSSLKTHLNNFDFDKALFVYGNEEKIDNFLKASSNIYSVNAINIVGLNVYDIIKHDKLLITQQAMGALMERLK